MVTSFCRKRNSKSRYSSLAAKIHTSSAVRDSLPVLSNGPDKKESNNGFKHVGMQKGANFTIVCTILLIGLNSKS